MSDKTTLNQPSAELGDSFQVVEETGQEFGIKWGQTKDRPRLFFWLLFLLRICNKKGQRIGRQVISPLSEKNNESSLLHEHSNSRSQKKLI